MNINNKINANQSFGKQALMTCKVKERETQADQKATLYKLNPENASDREDVLSSCQAYCIADDFNKQQYEKYPRKEFFMLQNDKTGDVISCAQISHHYSPNLDESGQYTLIEEAKENYAYKNGSKPLLAFIAHQAIDKYEEAVFTAFDEETLNSLDNGDFRKKDTGEYFAPKQNFLSIIKNAADEFHTNYLA